MTTKVSELTVNLCVLKLPSRNVVVEQQVNLTECTVLGLWKPEPTPDIAYEICPSIEESGLGSPAPGYGVLA